MRRPSIHRLLGLSVFAGLLAFTGVCLAPAASQDRSSGTRAEADAPGGEAEPDAPAGTGDEEVEVESSMRNEGGEKVKIMEFTDFDISGRLKSPQLLYFLNRLRAEFDRPRLPHRSFVGEMERSTHEKSF